MTSSNITIGLLGDVALHGLFCKEPEKNKTRFEEISTILQEPDLVFANLETPLWGNGEVNELKTKGPGVLLHTQQKIAKEVLPLLNIAAVSLANNHIYDCKESGIRNTIACLEELNIPFTGAGYKQEHLEPAIMEKNGRTVAFAAYVHETTRPAVEKDGGVFVNFFDEKKIIATIDVLKKAGHHVVISLHWGVDYSFYPTLTQRKAAKQFIDAGADIIMGHHPHTVQPYESYKKGYIFYSLGALCFGDFIYEGKLRALKRKTKKTILPFFTITGKTAPGILPPLTLKTCLSLKELQGNRITTRKVSLKRFLAFKFFLMKIKHRVKGVNFIIKIKESFFDRLIEYFFGYYRNPFIQLISFTNLKKIKYSLRDYKQR